MLGKFQLNFLVTNAILGDWINTGGCVSNNVDTNGVQCGSGRQRQTRTCKDGVVQKCNLDLRERTIKCNLEDCPPGIHTFHCYNIVFRLFCNRESIPSKLIHHNFSLLWVRCKSVANFICNHM